MSPLKGISPSKGIGEVNYIALTSINGKWMIKVVECTYPSVLWIHFILIWIQIRRSVSWNSGSGSDQKLKKILTFFPYFFNHEYNTQNYDFFCCLWAFYSYMYIKQKSDFFCKGILVDFLCAARIQTGSDSWFHEVDSYLDPPKWSWSTTLISFLETL